MRALSAALLGVYQHRSQSHAALATQRVYDKAFPLFLLRGFIRYMKLAAPSRSVHTNNGFSIEGPPAMDLLPPHRQRTDGWLCRTRSCYCRDQVWWSGANWRRL